MPDRLSFQCSCRLEGSLNIPDVRTTWSFRQLLAQGELGDKAIFEALSQQLQQHGYIPRGGQIVDASIVKAPVTQADTAEREEINQLQSHDSWNIKPMARTDCDARWAQKHGQRHDGHKLRANAEARYKLIRTIRVRAANADDGLRSPEVFQSANTRALFLANRGYNSRADRQVLARHGLIDGIARRAQPARTARTRLKQRHKAINRTSSRIARVFASLAQQGGKCVRAVTLARNALTITRQCAAYDVRRQVWLVKSAGASASPVRGANAPVKAPAGPIGRPTSPRRTADSRR